MENAAEQLFGAQEKPMPQIKAYIVLSISHDTIPDGYLGITNLSYNIGKPDGLTLDSFLRSLTAIALRFYGGFLSDSTLSEANEELTRYRESLASLKYIRE